MRRLGIALCFLLLATPVWAFPTNAVLDSFTGCTDTTTPPNSNWTNAVLEGATSSTVDCEDLAATSTTGGSSGDAYYNVTTFGANVEAYLTLTAAWGTGDRAAVLGRLVNIGANTTDGYMVSADDTANTFGILRLDDGAVTLLGEDSFDMAASDSIGMTIIGSQICSWYKIGAGAWTLQRCVIDTTYQAGGRIGLIVRGPAATGFVDNFGGGNISANRGTLTLD